MIRLALSLPSGPSRANASEAALVATKGAFNLPTPSVQALKTVVSSGFRYF